MRITFGMSGVVFSIGFLLSVSSVVLAQRDVASFHISEGDWLIVPTTLDGNVETFVGLRMSGSIGDNIDTVWFRRTTEQTWDSWSWRDQDQGKAIATVKSILGLPDSTDDKWPIVLSPEATDEPEVLSKGLLASDPFQSVAESMIDPSLLVTMLEDTGWRAAWLALWNYECNDEVVLEIWAEIYEEGNFLNEEFNGFVYELLIQNECLTTHIREQIWCWVEQYWASFDDESPISFNGTVLHLHPDWHPFDEIAHVYQDLYPSVPIVEALVDIEVWNALTPTDKGRFREMSLSHQYVELFTPDLYPVNPQEGVPELDPLAIPATPHCGDHQLFYDNLLTYLEEMPWTDRSIEACLWRIEGNWPWCGPRYDCYDDANTIGACLINKLREDEFEVSARNKGVWFKCGLLGLSRIGHTYTCIFFCGFWYIVDGSEVIAVIPGSLDEDVPIDLEVCRFLWSQGLVCDGECYIEDAGEWGLHDSPMREPNLWYTSHSEVSRVVACLRASGMSDAAIAESFSCSIPPEQLQLVLQWFEPPVPYTVPPPYVPYTSPNNPCPECYTLEP